MAYTVMGGMHAVPPPKHHTPIPDGPLSSVHITLERGQCLGACPAYKLELRGDGTGVYSGYSFVVAKGEHHFKVDPEIVQCILEDFRSADFWSLAPEYVASITDSPSYRVTLEIGGKKKIVDDYVGRAVGMPQNVTDLEDAIDRLAGDPWTRGAPGLVPMLEAEGFDFHSTEGGHLLVGAATYGPDETVIALLDRGAPATATAALDRLGRGDAQSAVESAAKRGRSALVRAMIAHGAFTGADAEDRKGRTLLAAAGSGDLDTVTEVLKEKPDPNARGEDGATPLMDVGRLARYGGAPVGRPQRLAIDRALVAAGADPRARAVDGKTAMFSAGSPEAVDMFVAGGARVEDRESIGYTPLMLAEDDDTAMRMIELGADIHAATDGRESVWTSGQRSHWQTTLAYLKAKGADRAPVVSPTYKQLMAGMIPDSIILTSAEKRAREVIGKAPAMIEQLKTEGFDFHSRQGALLLFRASNAAPEPVALSLIGLGAPVNQAIQDTEPDNSSVAAAARRGHLQVVRALVTAGAFDDAPYGAKTSALIAAAAGAHPDIVTELLKDGADPNGVVGEKSPMLEAGADLPNTEEAEPKWRAEKLEVMRLLLDAGGKVGAPRGVVDTPLHHAGSPEEIRLLIAAGADVNALDGSEDTPLFAVLDDDLAVALLDAGAKPVIKTDYETKSILKKAHEEKWPLTLAWLKAHGVTQ